METIVSNNSKQKIREALELLQWTAKEGRDQLKDLASNRYGELKSVLGDAKISLTDDAESLKERGEEKVRDVAGRVDDYVHTEPWRMMASAAAFGLLAGLLINRARR